MASADGMRLLRQSGTINAGPNRKYFGNNRGITCTTLSDQYSGFHGIVIPGTLRDLSLCWKVFWNRRPG
ncbi:Tn3 family transposase [Serratia nevei]|nr:Tn3 family transposase [Serratia nevei]MEC5891126.1 Tn3 family transposase [Serratia nevei]